MSNNNAHPCFACVALLVVIALLCATVAIIILDIVALKNTTIDDVNEECDGSALWYYVLVCLILTCVSLFFGNVIHKNKNNKNANDNDNQESVGGIGILNLGCRLCG